MTRSTMLKPSFLEKDKFEKFAARLRVVAWVWIFVFTVAFATQLDVASFIALELSSVVALELLGAAAIVVGPGSIGLGLSYVIERVSYLTADLHLL